MGALECPAHSVKLRRKLSLSRETVRRLQTRDLTRAADGTAIATEVCPTAGPGNICDLTCDLCVTQGGTLCETADCS